MVDAKFLRRARALARMRAIPVQVRIAVREEVQRQGVALEEAIRRRVPVKHGDLKATVRGYDSSNGERIRRTIVEGEPNANVPAEQARAVEFGRPDMEPQPHFFPTYRQLKKPMARAIKRAARRAIAKVLD